MPQIFRPGADSLFRLVLILLVLSPAIGMGIGYALVVAPWVSKEAFAPKQPVPFSHQHHVSGLGIDCRYCHSSVEHGPVASIPPTHTCMSCHSQIWTNAELLAPVRRSLEREEPIVWQRV